MSQNAKAKESIESSSRHDGIKPYFFKLPAVIAKVASDILNVVHIIVRSYRE